MTSFSRHHLSLNPTTKLTINPEAHRNIECLIPRLGHSPIVFSYIEICSDLINKYQLTNACVFTKTYSVSHQNNRQHLSLKSYDWINRAFKLLLVVLRLLSVRQHLCSQQQRANQLTRNGQERTTLCF